jgi:hypothetical protein
MVPGSRNPENRKIQVTETFRSKFRFERSKRSYDAVRHREESKPSKRKIHTLGFATRNSRICLPGVCADDTHIMLGWFVKQAK